MKLGKGSPVGAGMVLRCTVIAMTACMWVSASEPPVAEESSPSRSAKLASSSVKSPTTARDSDGEVEGDQTAQGPRRVATYDLQPFFEAVRLPHRELLTAQQQRLLNLVCEVGQLDEARAENRISWDMMKLVCRGSEQEQTRLAAAVNEMRLNRGREVFFKAWILNGSRERIHELTGDLQWRLLPGDGGQSEAERTTGIRKLADRPALRFSTDRKAVFEVKKQKRYPVATAVVSTAGASQLVQKLREDDGIKLVMSPAMVTRTGVPASLISEAQRPFVVGVQTASNVRQPVIDFLTTGLEVQLLPWFRTERSLHLNSMWSIRDVGGVDEVTYDMQPSGDSVTLQSPEYHTVLLKADLEIDLGEALVFHLPVGPGQDSSMASVVVLATDNLSSTDVSAEAGTEHENVVVNASASDLAEKREDHLPPRRMPAETLRTLPNQQVASWHTNNPPPVPQKRHVARSPFASLLPDGLATSFAEYGLDIELEAVKLLKVDKNEVSVEAARIVCTSSYDATSLELSGTRMNLRLVTADVSDPYLAVSMSGGKAAVEGLDGMPDMKADMIIWRCSNEGADEPSLTLELQGNVVAADEDLKFAAEQAMIDQATLVLRGSVTLELEGSDDNVNAKTIVADRIEFDPRYGAVIAERVGTSSTVDGGAQNESP